MTFTYIPCSYAGCETELRVPTDDVAPVGWICLQHQSHQHATQSVCRACGDWVLVGSQPLPPRELLCVTCRPAYDDVRSDHDGGDDAP